MRSAVQTIWRSRTRTRRCRCSAVLPPVSRCVRLSAASRPCTPPEGNGRNLGRFPREREADESEAGERAGDNAAPGSPTSARSAGSFRLFAAGTIRRVERAVGPYDAEKLRCGKGSQRGLDEKSPAVICQDKNNIERYTFSYVSKRQKHPPKPCKSYF